MPACGSSIEEAACLRGLSSTTKQGASPQGPAANPQRRHNHHQRQRQTPQPTITATTYLIRLIVTLIRKLIAYTFLAPLVWFSCWLCVGWLIFRVPLAAIVWFIRRRSSSTTSPAQIYESSSSSRRKCILVSGGSSVQAVHLTRNLSFTGARVIVCELEGLLGLARFSSSCSRYYSLPNPTSDGAAAYVAALQRIVRKEKCTHYIPVSASSPAYFDGLAKPHLELLGCQCFIPGAQELSRLDDPLELLNRAERLGLPTPGYRLLDSLDEATRLYEEGVLSAPSAAVHYALPAGPAGMRERRALTELRLPPTLTEFRQRISVQTNVKNQRWLIVKEPAGSHFVTCTTLRDSRILANVTCRVDESGALIPEDRPEVYRWLDRFFSERESRANVSGHLSFRLVSLDEKPGELVGIGCRIGVPLAYLCYNDATQANLILKRPCRHRQQQIIGQPLMISNNNNNGKVKSIDKRETLFLIWDPLPYLVYCYLQLPLGRFYEALGARAGCASRGGAIV